MAVVEQPHSTYRATADLVWDRTPREAGATVPFRQGYAVAKRLLDVSVSLILLVLLSPLMLLIALLIKLDSAGPVIFTQERVGFDPRRRRPRTFQFYKFRSMRHKNDDGIHRAHVANLIKQNTHVSSSLASLKMARDPRITRMGSVLRKTSLDELPQLINVLNGDMSLVGPRPALPYEVNLYEDEHWERLFALPGITGWWQVMGRNQVSFEDMVCMDVYYIRHCSIALDLLILLRTPRAVLSGKGAG